MIKKAVKRLVKRLFLKAREWSLEWSADDSPAGPLDDWAGSYTLNPVFVEVSENLRCDHKYVWGVVQGVHLAKVLGIRRVSVIEFGVAGGNSLVALEHIAEHVQRIFDVTVDVFGFDTGVGLPKPVDHRDMPNLWSQGFFPMDIEELRTRLQRAQLILGEVRETVPEFIRSQPAPIAFIGFDMDLYSSTMHALALLEADHRLLMPRVHCLFDDILGYSFGDCVGERLAISEFNAPNKARQISPIYGLRHYVPERYANRMWEKYYMAHIFDHPLYAAPDGTVGQGAGVLRD